MDKNTRKDASSNLPINSWNTPRSKKKKFNLSRKQAISILIAFLIIVAGVISILAIYLN